MSARLTPLAFKGKQRCRSGALGSRTRLPLGLSVPSCEMGLKNTSCLTGLTVLWGRSDQLCWGWGSPELRPTVSHPDHTLAMTGVVSVILGCLKAEGKGEGLGPETTSSWSIASPPGATERSGDRW